MMTEIVELLQRSEKAVQDVHLIFLCVCVLPGADLAFKSMWRHSVQPCALKMIQKRCEVRSSEIAIVTFT